MDAKRIAQARMLLYIINYRLTEMEKELDSFEKLAELKENNPKDYWRLPEYNAMKVPAKATIINKAREIRKDLMSLIKTTED